MSTATRRFADRTTAEVGTALSRDSVLVLPTGAVEPHGPHLPMSTDLVVAEALSSAVVDAGARAGHDVWLLPALARFLIKPEKLAGQKGNSLFAH